MHDLAPGYMCELFVPYVPRRVLRSAELNLLTVPPGKPGKYGSRSFARASANLWNSLRGERAAWLKNSPTLESFKINLKTFLFWERFSSYVVLLSLLMSIIVFCFVSLYVILCNIVCFGMFTRLDYSSALEYSIIRELYKYCILLLLL